MIAIAFGPGEDASNLQDGVVMRKLNSRLLAGGGSVYGAKLLFQWRVVDNGKAKRRKLCEERVVLLRARSPRQALARAKRYGKAQSY